MDSFLIIFILDELVKSRRKPSYVIPAKAGIQYFKEFILILDPGFRRGDGLGEGSEAIPPTLRLLRRSVPRNDKRTSRILI